MIQLKCIRKFKDKSGRIHGYRLVDINGVVQDITPNNLKDVIKSGKVTVVNLTLTSDNRLIDKKQESIDYSTLITDKVNLQRIRDTDIKIAASICRYLNIKPTNKGLNVDENKITYKHSFNTLLSDNVQLEIEVSDRKVQVKIETEFIVYRDNCKDGTQLDLLKMIKRVRREISKLNCDPSEVSKDPSVLIRLVLDHLELAPYDILVIPQMIDKYSRRLGIHNEVLKYLEDRKKKLSMDSDLISTINRKLKTVNAELNMLHDCSLTVDDVLRYLAMTKTDYLDDLTDMAFEIHLSLLKSKLAF